MIDPGFTSPSEPRDYWPILRSLLIVGLLVLGARYLWNRLDGDTYTAILQDQNQARLEYYLDALEQHHEWEGGYPLNLVDSLDPGRIPGGIAKGLPLRDAWDHPLRYFSDGKIFLLVSVGRDGQPDDIEYYDLRQEGVARDVCHRPDADIVVSDLGWHVACRPEVLPEGG
jgi:hypothetical protein